LTNIQISDILTLKLNKKRIISTPFISSPHLENDVKHEILWLESKNK